MRVSIQDACAQLKRGGVVAIPTETVYGLAAAMSDTRAVERIFMLKNRPQENPLIVHVSNASCVEEYAEVIPNGFDRLAQVFWPGPLTLIVPAKKNAVPTVVRAGLDTVAFRVPNQPLALQALTLAGPLVMPSANLSGKPSATRPEHVETDLGSDFPVLDGGETVCGVESTILLHRESRWEIVRLGALPADAFEHFLGYIPSVSHAKKGSAPLCPGQMFRHYAPMAKLVVDEGSRPETCEWVVGFSDRTYPKGCQVLCLGQSTNPNEVAKNLYKILRALDERGVAEAWVDMDFPSAGLWTTINERIRKAACNI